MWSDGSSWEYTNWSDGNPNGYDPQGIPDRISLNYGQLGRFDDDRADKLKPFICKKRGKLGKVNLIGWNLQNSRYF